jgi:GR25 family glycosyltransferase involved in LPS biosynthesis
MIEMTAFVINLMVRSDRWRSVEKQRALLGIPIQRVEAINQDSVDPNSLQLAAKGVAATWLSHRKAAAEFLETDSNFGMILEDDFQLSSSFRIPSTQLLSELEADFVQLGYLRVTPWESFDLNIANIRDRVLRTLNSVSNKNGTSRALFQNRLLIRERSGVPSSLIPTDIRPGGHCYIISRKMASAMQELNNPIIFSADELFVSISKMRAFRMFRVRKSIVSQSNSPTSVDVRFKNS